VPADFYEAIKSMEDVEKAYEELKGLVEAQPGYDIQRHGEGNELRNIEEGDVLGIKTSKNVYAIVKVQGLATGNTGHIALTVKADKRAETAVEAIAPSEMYFSYSFEVDQLNTLGGVSLLDLATGTGYLVTEGYYNQDKIDAIVYNEGGNLTVSSVSRDDIPVLNEYVYEIASDW